MFSLTAIPFVLPLHFFFLIRNNRRTSFQNANFLSLLLERWSPNDRINVIMELNAATGRAGFDFQKFETEIIYTVTHVLGLEL